jgi:predicted O-methyltransferase YrrM
MGLLDNSVVLREMLQSGTALDERGERQPLHSHIPERFAEALYRTVLARRPGLVVEVGMAMGCSTLAILAALQAIGGPGRLLSIDPYQSAYKNCGLVAVRRAGLATRHEHIAEPDFIALPRLLAAGTRVDLGYIDGNHTFDFALLDFWYLDRMIPVGGVVAFNDCAMPAVHKVIRFLLTHRRYVEVDVGLRASYVDYSRVRGAIRRLMGAKPQTFYRNFADRYFQKQDNWEPKWDFFAPF